MAKDREDDWQGVYTTKAADAVSWFQSSPEASLRMIAQAGLHPPAAVIDVGGGASTLVDELVRRGFEVTVMDIAPAALSVSRERLGQQADAVNWQVGNVTEWRADREYDLWHDRAVFHFLTDREDRERYLQALRSALRPGGFLVVATFAEDGPERCSGLPVRRYNATELASEFGGDFTLIRSERDVHQTPWGSDQSFTWALFQRRL